MPSIYSDQLKQAIIYIRAGELEIAKEIILEIIQNDPDYEKAWIWLVETVPDHSGKIDVLKTRLEEYPDDSPLTQRALQRLAPEVLVELSSKAPISPPEVHAVTPQPVEEVAEEVISEAPPILSEDDSEDIIRDRLGLDESDAAELFDTSPVFEESSSEDVEFSGTDNFEDLFEDAPEIDDDLTFENVAFEEINFDKPELEETGFEEISFEEPKADEGSFSGEDNFENLFEDIQDQEPLSTEELGRNLMMEPEDDEDLFEKNLEDFLQNNESEALFVEQETPKPQQPEKQEDIDLTDFDSWLSGDDETEEQTEEEDDELSAFLANGFEMETEEEESSTSQSNPFVLSDKESMNLFGEDVTEAEVKKKPSNSTSQSLSVFSEEGLKELGIDEPDTEVQFELSEGSVFPIMDDEIAEPVSADDLLDLGDDLRAEVMGNEVAKSPSKKLEKTKTNKKEKKKSNDKQTFLFGCSIIAAVLILTMVGFGYIFWQNLQSRPPEPTSTPLILPTTTPTEEYITDAPWLEGDPTEVPTETDQ